MKGQAIGQRYSKSEFRQTPEVSILSTKKTLALENLSSSIMTIYWGCPPFLELSDELVSFLRYGFTGATKDTPNQTVGQNGLLCTISSAGSIPYGVSTSSAIKKHFYERIPSWPCINRVE